MSRLMFISHKAFFLFFSLLAVISKPCASASDKEWLVYDRSILVANEYHDGDSFAAKPITGYTYLFRLYGVDCPETDERFEERLADQAKDFKIKQEEVIKWGEKAAEFTRDFLSKPFRVYTQKIKADGASGKSRYYAIVINDEGVRLDEALVKAGLARAHGIGAVWNEPMWEGKIANFSRRMTSRRYLSGLRMLEKRAKRSRAGIWGN
jgi:endonuclease YncB( thermonuclease family)